MLEAQFWQGTNAGKGAHTVTVDATTTKYLLHGEEIVKRENNKLTLSSCGYRTATTLRALRSVLHHAHTFPFEMHKAWELSDCRTGRVVPFTDGMTLLFVDGAWHFSDTVDLSPAMGGKDA